MLTNMLREFRDFAMRGNVVDLAVGVIIGAAFSKIINSLVDDIIMPVIGAVTGGLDFSNYFIPLSKTVTAHSLTEARRAGRRLRLGQFPDRGGEFRHRRLRPLPRRAGDHGFAATSAA